MSGNTIGRLFTVTTFGESHGPAMGCIVDGCPPGLPLSEADVQQDVDRRRSGTSHFVSQRREADQVRILSGVFEGRTTGTPIGILIDNTDARVTVVASGVPAGLGEPVFDRLDADIAHALMSINAVKAVEIGAGTRAAAQRGSEHRDELTPTGFRSNHAGGVLGGISSGQDVIAHLTLKPTSSIQVPGSTIDTHGNAVEIVTTGRHDPCVGLRATPIAEAMLPIVLMDHYLRQRAQNADVKSATPDIAAASRG